MSLKLFGYWRSSAAWRVRWALNLKGLSCVHHFVNLKTGEQKSPAHLKVNPSGRVPMLLLEDGTRLNQSLGIISYLDSQVFKKATKIIPEDPLNRARAFELWEVIAADTHPLQNISVISRYSDDPQKRVEWSAFYIQRGLSVFDETLTRVALAKDFSLGNSPSLPDLALIPQIYNALRFGLDVQGTFPRLWKIYQNALQTEECLVASPEKQQDAVEGV
ncbi:maleylacetoacetate isomerase [bacterium]|nr:maleylacetoacetate isomerase [bacterium]